MDIQDWVNTVVRCNSDDNSSQYGRKTADSPLRSKRKEHSPESHRCRERILPSPDRIHTSKARKLGTGDSVRGRKLVKDSKIGQPVEILTCSESVNDNSSNIYRRKPRRKTRPERYDLKDEKKHRSKMIFKPNKASRKRGKRDGCNGKTRSNRPIPFGSTYFKMAGLCPSRPRLSVC